MNTTSRILGEATRPPTEMELTDPSCAYFYAKNTIKGPFPEGEAVIAKNTYWSYNYALQVIEGRFPKGEAVIATDPYCAYDYARDVIKGRFPEAEEAMAKEYPEYSKKYLKLFPDAKIEWYAREWIDWTQL